jgi:uncharacterized membrane protein YhaH (DUF805 family)
MFGIGLPEIIIIVVILIICLIPTLLVIKILHKAGFSGWFSILSFIPIVNLMVLWIFAFMPWPNVDRT